MARDTAAIGADVVIGTNTPDVETTVEALIRTYNRQPLDTGLAEGDLVFWDDSAGTWVRVAGTAAEGQVPTVQPDGTLGWDTPSRFLAALSYSPVTEVIFQTTSTTFVDVDAVNLAVTFDAPPSGQVYVTLNGVGGSNSSITFWGLREGTTVVGSNRMVSGIVYIRQTAIIKVTGLTAGQSYTYKWAIRSFNDTTTSYLRYGQDVQQVAGPATMQVEAA